MPPAPPGRHPPTIHHPVGAGHARLATLRRRLLLVCIVGRGLDPSACPFPAYTRSPFHHPVGAGHARPATSRRPPLHLPCSPKTPNSATLLPPITPIICARQPPSPQYAPYPNFSLKLCRKNQKTLLSRVCDKNRQFTQRCQ